MNYRGAELTIQLISQIQTHLRLIRQDRPDPPLRALYHLLPTVHSPRIVSLPSLVALFPEFLSIGTNKGSKVEGETFARVPEVVFGDGDRHSDVDTTEVGDFGDCWTDVLGVPETWESAREG